MRKAVYSVFVLLSCLLAGQSITFGETSMAGLPSLSNPTMEWVDFDNDGDLDLIYHGLDVNTYFAGIFANTGDNVFTLHQSLPSWVSASFSWQDIDLDGKMDFVVAAESQERELVNYLYRQNDEGKFEQSVLGFQGLYDVEFQWAAFNNDQFPDLVMKGRDDEGQWYGFVSKNLGDGFFSTIYGYVLGGSFFANEMEMVPSDYNSDGLTDLVVVTENSLYFFEQDNTSNINYQSSLRQLGHYSLPLTKSVIDGSGVMNYFFWAEIENVVEVTSGGSYFDANTIIEESIGIVDGDFVFKLNDSFGDGITSSSGLILKDATDATIFEYTFGTNGPFSNIDYPFCIGAGCYESPLTLTIHTDDYPEETSWQIVEAGASITNGPARMTYSFFDGVTLSSDPVGEVIYGWFDVDQDGQSDALVQPAPGQWQWLLNESGTWSSTGTFLSNDKPQVVDFDADGIPEMIATSINGNGTTSFSINYVIETLMPYQTAVPSIAFSTTDESTNTAYVYWDVFDPYATYVLELEKDGVMQETMKTAADPFGYWGNTPQGQMKINEPATYNVHIRAIGANGISSESVSTPDFMVSSQVAEDPYVVIQQDFPNLSTDGVVRWIDIDNDGDLDLFMTGASSPCSTLCFESLLYENVNGKFEQLDVSFLPNDLSQIYYADWGDYDNDGDLDAIVAIYNVNTMAYQTVIFEQRDKKFFQDTRSSFPYENRNLKWVDFDNDGDLDLSMSRLNTDSNSEKTFLYENNEGVFYELETSFFDLPSFSLDWVDYDKDGDFDLFLTTIEEGGLNSQLVLFQNNMGSFERIDPAVDQLIDPALAFGDYDNDGDPDLLIAGAISIGPYEYKSVLFRNEDGDFVEDQVFEKQWGRSIKWNDYDADGDLDFIISGDSESSFGPVTLLYQNDGGTFNIVEDNIIDLSNPVFAFGDFDLDDRMDFLIKGNISSTNNRTRLYKNNTLNSNTQPDPPSNLRVEVFANGGLNEKSITITWEAGSDAETPAAGLQYEVTLWRNGEIFTVQVPFDMNAYNTLSQSFYNLPPGSYTALVQTRDASFKKSEYSDPVYFEITEPFVLSTLSPQINPDFFTIRKADYDNDGDLDMLVFDLNGSFLYENDGSDFVQKEHPFEQLNYGGNAAWSDYDLDGDLDVVISGQILVDNSVSPFMAVYKNDGGMFVEDDQGIEQGFTRIMNWFDIENDGDLDLMMTGEFLGFESKLVFYENQASVLAPVELSIITLDGNQERESLTWGDFDNDGDTDFIQSGTNQNTNYVPRTNMWDNENGTFVLKPTSLPNLGAGILTSVDIDADGDLDLFFDQQNFGVRIFKNEGGDFIELESSFPIYVDQEPEVAWGDFDNDGDLDLIRNGFFWVFELQFGYDEARLYRNDNGVFVDTQIFIEGSSFDFIDHDKDGDLDILGVSPSGQYVFYQNTLNHVNQVPGTVTNLLAEETDGEIHFSWSTTIDTETTSEALSYNFHLMSETENLVMPTVTPSEDLSLFQLGNTGLNPFYTFKGEVDDGVYHWSVQAIDNAFKPGAFSEEKTFTYCYNYASSSISISTTAQNFVKDVNIPFTSDLPEGTTGVLWDFGDGSTSTSANPVHLFASAGSFTVTLTSTSDLGCANSTTMEIEVSDDELSSRITTVITPNGDGKNDFLYVENGTQYPNNLLKIFNLQGHLLYQKTNYQNDWGGTHKGKPLPAGQYLAEFYNQITGEKTHQVFNILY